MKKLTLTLFFVLVLFSVLGCAKKTRASTTEKSLSIVAVNFPCYDFARAVAPNANIKLLIKPGMEAHSFDPTPKDIISINSADLFLYIGGESDEWVEKILASNSKSSSEKNLRFIDYVSTIGEDENAHEIDEHIWTSTENAEKMLAALAVALGTIDSKNAATYETNAAAYATKIRAYDETFAALARAKKPIVMGDRFPLKYFAQQFGFAYEAAFNGCSTAIEASPATIAHLIDTVNANKLNAVYHIELSNKKIASVIAEQTGAKILQLHSAQNVSRDEFEQGITYADILKANAQNLAAQ